MAYPPFCQRYQRKQSFSLVDYYVGRALLVYEILNGQIYERFHGKVATSILSRVKVNPIGLMIV